MINWLFILIKLTNKFINYFNIYYKQFMVIRLIKYTIIEYSRISC